MVTLDADKVRAAVDEFTSVPPDERMRSLGIDVADLGATYDLAEDIWREDPVRAIGNFGLLTFGMFLVQDLDRYAKDEDGGDGSTD